MVHRMDDVSESPLTEKPCRKKVNVKTEFDSSVDGFLPKRPRIDPSVQEYNPLEEPSPLGLKLKKSPSFLDLIQMKLSQEKSAPLAKTLARKEKGGAGNDNKLKASNLPASSLKIGTWEYNSRYEGDLVAKCYFAKHKLVWEVLDGGLKNKIEIQWSDIMAIKANYPDNSPGTLDVVVARQPLFFREINPQPRKHTLWQATTDFTCGQATVHRQHFLQFPQGTLGKHFEKLIQCDPRLRFLSQQPEIVRDNLYFQPLVSSFADHGDHGLGFDLKTGRISDFPGLTNTISSAGVLSSDVEKQDAVGTPPGYSSRVIHPLISGMSAMEGDAASKNNETCGLNLLNHITFPGLHPSMSVGDLVNHIGDCISEQMRSDNPNFSIDESQKRDILNEVTHYLLSDSQMAPVSDERYIMSRVNSLCCLLQKDPAAAKNSHIKSENNTGRTADEARDLVNINERLGSGMSRKDSVAELLLHLPRIASLPQFLVDIPEDLCSQSTQ